MESLPLRACPAVLMLVSCTACEDVFDLGASTGREGGVGPVASAGGAVVLAIDEESIDNGSPPNSFSDVDVNDQRADVGVRDPLAFFTANIGRTIDVFTGEVGDEGWHVVRTIPSSWKTAGPTGNGTRNFLLAGPGLGSRNQDNDREALLDQVPNVTPLRATGQKMLVGQTICAVVFDGNVGINYSPLLGSLKGANLGIVAFDVLDVRRRVGGSTGSLPRVSIRIRDAADVCAGPLALFANAPVPQSSSEPHDVAPPTTAPEARFESAP